MTRASFDCPRTCPAFERRDVCRFQPLFSRIAVQVVTSHTTAVRVILKQGADLVAAVHSLGGTVLGQGEHKLFASNTATGLGFTIGKCSRPFVLQASGELACDSMDRYHVRDITAAYVRAAARAAAEANRWQVVSDGATGLVLRHPNGGRLTVKPDGTCEASGFRGLDCHATAPIEDAIGARGARRYKPEASGAVTRTVGRT